MNELEKFHEIDTFLFDVDGVFTDSQLLVTENGELLRQMNVRDGYAVKLAIRQGYRVGIITGGSSEGVKLRLQGLGVRDIFLGISEKIAAYETYLERYQINLNGEGRILYMGDDMPDYEVMRRVGLPCCPSDAAAEIVGICKYISPREGGKGCVRDVIEKVLKIQGKWA
ncbi:MAG: HAD-IA family hydrolase [Bacteroidota bacterium]